MRGAPDVIGIVEAAYSLDGDDRGWLAGLATASRPWFDAGLGVAALTFDVHPRGAFHAERVAVVGATPDLEAGLRATLQCVPPDVVEQTFGAPHVLTTTSTALGMGPAFEQFPLAVAMGHPHGAHDLLCLKVADPTGLGLVILGALPAVREVKDGREVVRWSRCAAHMAGAMRLRRALMSDASAAPDGEAVLGPDGKLHHAVGPATERTAREVLRAAVVASERARGPRRREDPDRALADWRALVAGRWSLVDRFERDGRRYVVARRNDPDVPDPRGLTRRERQVAAYAVLGRSGQAIAYELGLARSTVVQHLASAMKKLSVATRAELAQLVRPGSGSPTPSNPNK